MYGQLEIFIVVVNEEEEKQEKQEQQEKRRRRRGGFATNLYIYILDTVPHIHVV